LLKDSQGFFTKAAFKLRTLGFQDLV